MRRQFDHMRSPLLRESSILPRTVLTMGFWIVENRLWQLGPKWKLTQGLRVPFEQHKDDRNNLSSNTPHDLGAASRSE
jgi:hypothetical protein